MPNCVINYCVECNKLINIKAKRCRSCSKKGKFNPMFGKEGISPMLNKHHTKETKVKMSIQKLNKNNPNWKGNKVSLEALHQ